MALLDFFSKVYVSAKKIPAVFISRREHTTARLIINPLAGEGKTKKALRTIKQALKENAPSLDVEITFSRQKGDFAVAAKEAAGQGKEIVICAGGDGAINEVIQGLAHTNAALGILPLGTANVFAQEIGIPKDMDAACTILETGVQRRVDLGKANGRYFIGFASCGVDALVAKEVHENDAKDRIGAAAYVMFTMKHLKKIPYVKARVEIDGKEHIFNNALAIMVGNATSHVDGKNYTVKGIPSMDDGYLNLLIVQRVTFLGVARQIMFYLRGVMTYYKDAAYWDTKFFRAKNIKVHCDPAVLVHTDGEVVGETPYEFTVDEKALTLILPAQPSAE